MPTAIDNVAALRPDLLRGTRRADAAASRRLMELIGPVSLAACPLTLIAYLGLCHGVNPITGLATLAALYGLGVVPGYLAQRLIFRVQVVTPFENLVSSLLLGTLLTPLVWYAFCWLGLSTVFGGLVVTAALATPLACGWHRRPIEQLRRLVTPADTPILWVALGLTILWSYTLRLVDVDSGRVVILPYTDHVLHSLLVAELARGVPMQTVPFLAGATQWAYHQMPDVWCDLMRRATGATPQDAYFFLALPLRYVFVVLAGYLAMVRRFGRPAAVAGVLGMLTFVGFPQRLLLDNWLLVHLHQSYPAAFGLVGVFLIFHYVFVARATSPRGAMLLASTLSVVLLWYKANYALVVAPAVALVCLWVFLRRRDPWGLALCFVVSLVLAGVRYLDLSTADLRGTFVFAPMAFVTWWWSTLGTWWGSSVASTIVNGGVMPAIEALPPLAQWPAKLAFLLARKFQIGLLVLPYLVYRCRFARGRSQARLLDAFILALLATCIIGFVLLPVHERLVWNVSIHVLFLVDAVLLLLMGPAVVDVVGRLARRGRWTAVGTTILLLALVIHNAVLLCREVLPAVSGRHEIDPGTAACARYVQTHTPTDAVILQPMYRDASYGPALLMQRRMVLGNGDLWRRYGTPRNVADVERLMADLEAFYAGTDAATARAILDRYHVDYVIADRSVADDSSTESPLERVFEKDNVAVYRAAKPLRPAKPPTPMTASRG